MEKEDRKKCRERLLRLVFLAEHPDFDTNPNIRAEWERLKDEVNTGHGEIDKQIVEVLYKGEIIYTGTRAEVRDKCKISKSNLVKKLGLGSPDKHQRYYRVKE